MGRAVFAVDGVAGNSHHALDEVFLGLKYPQVEPVVVAPWIVANHHGIPRHVAELHVRDRHEQPFAVRQGVVHAGAVHADDAEQEGLYHRDDQDRADQRHDPLPHFLLDLGLAGLHLVLDLGDFLLDFGLFHFGFIDCGLFFRILQRLAVVLVHFASPRLEYLLDRAEPVQRIEYPANLAQYVLPDNGAHVLHAAVIALLSVVAQGQVFILAQLDGVILRRR